MMFRTVCVTLSCITLLLLSGCGKGYPGKEKLYPVEITVLESGKPFNGAVVILMRQGGEKLNTSGLTDDAGKAIIMVDAEWPGAPIGTYQVRISKDPPFTPDLTHEEEAKLRPDEFTRYEARMVAKRRALKPIVPVILSSDQSPFTIEVTSGENVKTFDIVADLQK
jgi:predicted component of type VI protein secretion system